MRISQRTTYAIIAAVDLALQDSKIPIQARAIAQRQGIPARFLEQVLHTMKQAGLVSSQRGAQGGYVLGRSPDRMSLADILEALEGPVLSSNNWAARSIGAPSPRLEVLLAPVWERINQAEMDILSHVTIEQLATRQRQLEQQRSLMYHI